MLRGGEADGEPGHGKWVRGKKMGNGERKWAWRERKWVWGKQMGSRKRKMRLGTENGFDDLENGFGERKWDRGKRKCV